MYATQKRVLTEARQYERAPASVGSAAIAFQQLAGQAGNQAMLAHLGQRSEPASTGESLPNAIMQRFERKSGVPLDDVRVHYNSDKPERFDAEAYAQGNEIFIGPGNEHDLEHEIGHVVQQKQGLVKPTRTENGQNVNDDDLLEKRANILQIRPICTATKCIQKATVKKKIHVKKSPRRFIRRIAEGERKGGQYKRHITTFHYLSKRGQQGPHTIPVAGRNVFISALRKKKIDPVKFCGTRLLPLPETAEKVVRKLFPPSAQSGITDAEKDRRISAYSKAYKRVYKRFVEASTLDSKIFEFEKLMDLSPVQTYCIASTPTKKQIQGKGERQRTFAKALLNKDFSVLDIDKSVYKAKRLKRWIDKTYLQMCKVVNQKDGEDAYYSDYSDVD